MNFFKKHAETTVIIISILGSIIGSMSWMNGKFNDIDLKFARVDQNFLEFEKEISNRFVVIEKDVAIIKTIMLMKNMMPEALAAEIDATEGKI